MLRRMRIGLLLVCGILACGGPTNEPMPPGLSLVASAARVAPGGQMFFTATRGGRTVLDATWASGDPSVLARVTSSSPVTAEVQ